MVMKCSETERPLKVPPARNLSTPLEMPRFRWGSTRILRCQIPNGGGEPIQTLEPSVPPPPPPPVKKRKLEPHQGGGAISTPPPPPPPNRLRLVIRLPVRSHGEEPAAERDRSSPPAPPANWNLRPRAAAAAPDKKDRPVEAETPGNAPVRLPPNSTAPSLNLCSRAPNGEEKRKKKNEKKAEFRLSLTKEEIEADFIAMTGAKPLRRPKRRPRAVQNHLDSIFPGSCLPKTIAPSRYRVPKSH